MIMWYFVAVVQLVEAQRNRQWSTQLRGSMRREWYWRLMDFLNISESIPLLTLSLPSLPPSPSLSLPFLKYFLTEDAIPTYMYMCVHWFVMCMPVSSRQYWLNGHKANFFWHTSLATCSGESFTPCTCITSIVCTCTCITCIACILDVHYMYYIYCMYITCIRWIVCTCTCITYIACILYVLYVHYMYYMYCMYMYMYCMYVYMWPVCAVVIILCLLFYLWCHFLFCHSKGSGMLSLRSRPWTPESLKWRDVFWAWHWISLNSYFR